MKLFEFESKTSKRILYLYKQQGFPEHADVIVHPETNSTALLALPDVEANKRVTYRFGSNMTMFPKRVNNGANPQHYGRSLHAYSESSLIELCRAYQL